MSANFFVTSKIKPIAPQVGQIANNVNVAELATMNPTTTLALEAASATGINSDAVLEQARTTVQGGIKTDMFKSAARAAEAAAMPALTPPSIELPGIELPALNVADAGLLGGASGFLSDATASITGGISYLEEKAALAIKALDLCPGGQAKKDVIDTALGDARKKDALGNAVNDFLKFNDSDLLDMLSDCAGLLRGLGSKKISALAGTLAGQGNTASLKLLVDQVGSNDIVGLGAKLLTASGVVPQLPGITDGNFEDLLTVSGLTKLALAGTATSVLGPAAPFILNSGLVEAAVGQGTAMLGVADESAPNSHTKLEMAAVVGKMIKKRATDPGAPVQFGVNSIPSAIETFSAFA